MLHFVYVALCDLFRALLSSLFFRNPCFVILLYPLGLYNSFNLRYIYMKEIELMINVELAKRYCCEDISHIENCTKALDDIETVWIVHHRNGEKVSKEYLITHGLYYNRPASELIFLHPLEHFILHNPNAKYLYRDSDGVVKKRLNTSRHNREHGKGYLYQKRGRGCWRVRVTIHGKTRDISTHCIDRNEAELKSQEIIESLK